MNNWNVLHSAFTQNGTPRDAEHTPARYREAFARIYVILHGGTVDQVNARLQRLGLPAVQAQELFSNPFPQLRIVWSPLAISLPQVAGNAAANFYPGDQYVDVVGGDIYSVDLSAPFGGLEALFTDARRRGKPFSIPEAGITDRDDPAFILRLCEFLKQRPAVESFLFYESKPGSQWDLDGKPKSRAAYRQCITPLAGPLPDWAAANAPGGGAAVETLTLTPRPESGPAPHSVTFSIEARLSVPIQQWLLVFDDGTETGGPGPPPATVRHTYAAAGIYPATLIVWPFPPFTTATARFYTSADVTVGTNPAPVLSIEPTPDSGPPPLAVSFRIEETLTGPITGWELIFDDGKSREGTGAPPHFAGHQFADEGTYDVLLVVNQSNNRRYMALANVVAGAGGAGGGGAGGGGAGGGGGTGGQQQQQPPAATRTGVVLVNGRPFTGGVIPFNSNVDVTRGTLTMTTPQGRMQVYGQNGITARFRLVRGTDQGRQVFELRLIGGNFTVCPRRRTSSASATTTVVRQLWGKGKGRFRTKGRYASATVRGTTWLTADRCDATLIRVRVGVLDVRDLPDRRTIRIRAPRTYLARP
jgi:hypothetical protein